MSEGKGQGPAEGHFPVCTHCGHTWAEYRARGLLGCPHCYAAFGEALQADLAWLHQALAFLAPATGLPEGAQSGAPDPETLARWREQLAEAVRSENYEEAARLKGLLRASAPRGPGLGVA
jgi:protein arginine kinase activator